MIRAESFAITTEDFAAGRKRILTAADDELRPHIKDALTRVGLPSWERSAVDAALDVFDRTARSEVDAWGPILDDMRDAFAHDLGEALKKTKRADPAQANTQLETITRWISTMAVNAGTEAATTSDPNGDVGLEWITMSDSQVRHTHRDANGQTVPTGHEFEVGGEKLLYPGQPVGDPSVWINCRCVCRPVMLDAMAVKSTAWTATSDSGARSQPTPTDASSGEQGPTVAATASGPSGASELSRLTAGHGPSATATSPKVDSTTSATPKPSLRAGAEAASASTASASIPTTSHQPHQPSSPSAALNRLSVDGTATDSKPTASTATSTATTTPAGAPEVTVASSAPAGPASAPPTTVAGEPKSPSTGDPAEGKDPQDGDVSTTCVIVALPAENDPISAASSEADGAHATLLFLGDTSTLDPDALKAALDDFVRNGQVGVITERVNGNATLGKDSADVVLFDAANLVFIREGLLEQNAILTAYDAVDQFPTWLPHVTLGYPETPRLSDYAGEAITFDRLALWFGEDRSAIYPLGEAMPEKDVVHPEDPGFTQEMADAFAAATPEEPADAAPAAEAPADPPMLLPGTSAPGMVCSPPRVTPPATTASSPSAR